MYSLLTDSKVSATFRQCNNAKKVIHIYYYTDTSTIRVKTNMDYLVKY